MPWIHLYIDTNGNAKACCNTSITYGNVNNQSLQSIWEGESIKTFRKKLREGKQDNRCASCFKREAANKSSVRTETLENHSEYLKWIEETSIDGECKVSKPVYLDIRYSNVCNLKCRTCWHGASSSWFNDAKLLKATFGDQAIIKATTDNNELINELFSLDTTFDEVYFAGGEPLMMEEHYTFLDALLNSQQTSVHLRYNTNLSTLTLKNKSVLDYWKQFTHVTLAVSIDAIGEKSEYIRTGLNWTKLLENITLIKDTCPHVQLQIAPTVSILSILTLGELHSFFVKNKMIGIDNIYLNILDRPNYYNCKIAPELLKEKIKSKLNQHIEWLLKNDAEESVIMEFKAVIEYLLTTSKDNDLKAFKNQIVKLDTIRDESFKVTFPELATAFQM